jgi:hypothetical protein
VLRIGDGGLNVVKSVWQDTRNERTTYEGMVTVASPNSQDMNLS